MTCFYTHARTALFLLSLLLLTACSNRISAVAPEEQGQLTFRFETTEATSPHAVGRFTATGALVDEGRFEAYMAWGGPEEGPTTVYGWRKLVGHAGTVMLRYVAYIDQDNGRVRGFSKVEKGTGDYEALVGCREAFELESVDEQLPLKSSHRF